MMSLSCVPPDFMAAVGWKEHGQRLPAEACERGRMGGAETRAQAAVWAQREGVGARR